MIPSFVRKHCVMRYIDYILKFVLNSIEVGGGLELNKRKGKNNKMRMFSEV